MSPLKVSFNPFECPCNLQDMFIRPGCTLLHPNHFKCRVKHLISRVSTGQDIYSFYLICSIFISSSILHSDVSCPNQYLVHLSSFNLVTLPLNLFHFDRSLSHFLTFSMQSIRSVHLHVYSSVQLSYVSLVSLSLNKQGFALRSSTHLCS